jgi:hypothetical protein
MSESADQAMRSSAAADAPPSEARRWLDDHAGLTRVLDAVCSPGEPDELTDRYGFVAAVVAGAHVQATRAATGLIRGRWGTRGIVIAAVAGAGLLGASAAAAIAVATHDHPHVETGIRPDSVVSSRRSAVDAPASRDQVPTGAPGSSATVSTVPGALPAAGRSDPGGDAADTVTTTPSTTVPFSTAREPVVPPSEVPVGHGPQGEHGHRKGNGSPNGQGPRSANGTGSANGQGPGSANGTGPAIGQGPGSANGTGSANGQGAGVQGRSGKTLPTLDRT